MKLSSNKLHYIWFHLDQHWFADPLIREKFLVLGPEESLPALTKDRIIFRLTEGERPAPIHCKFEEISLPVLFTGNPTSDQWFVLDEHSNLWFTHDLLSSVFYVLSGRQEMENRPRDCHDRFPFSSSIQKELQCASIPLVNYYFEILLQGLEQFARNQGQNIRRKRLFPTFGFALSHDVDRIAYYHIREVLHEVKRLFFYRTNFSEKVQILQHIKNGLKARFGWSRITDPWWNFEWMMNLEKQLGMRSSFYFLSKEDRKMDSKYTFKNKKIKTLISNLNKNGFETSLHGCYHSFDQDKRLKKQIHAWKKLTGKHPAGVRQHYLRYKLPQTSRIHAAQHFAYDATLGFADHDGFRNGYSYPFRPYDHERDEMINIWEIPLIMMEMSVLDYKKASNKELQNLVFKYIKEAIKFGGIFSLLWHNCRLNNMENPGITDFYQSLLKQIVEENPTPVRNIDLVERIQQHP